MPTTRSGDKGAAGAGGESAGSKHQITNKTSPASKRTKKDGDKQQKTIEETLPSPTEAYGSGHQPAKPMQEAKTDEDQKEPQPEDQPANDGDAEQPGARDGAVPSSILEKGLIYFFFRGRVGIDEPSSVNEIARSYMVLRPLEKDAKLGEGTINDAGNSRLIAIPKKVLPLSGRDRWIAFVEKSDASFKTLKDDFLSANDYTTKTAGVRHSPGATPVAEGIYAITTTGRESHLAYMITLPSDLGEVQTEIGLREKGSFILSTRNPSYEAPGGTALPEGPDYPEEVLDEFRALRWMPSQPKHLDYVSTQFLLVGESSGIEKATEPQKEDKKEGKEEPVEEMQKLEDEDTHRMEALKGDDSTTIFADLDAHAKDYPKLPTTF
ncbi:Uu.00g095910.m01.CDS01 [Anthostomella pinea]|uniref:Uu.00g095910.m01.CDS01 n=1 Tax=Anthostomella pinea TaxID=933095 RepID=A0AAI8VCU0_9PEZI|nr:Uu.00g095910.m01.CDS01 [Anthostomella pinea]